jgi:hypothetical protein
MNDAEIFDMLGDLLPYIKESKKPDVLFEFVNLIGHLLHHDDTERFIGMFGKFAINSLIQLVGSDTILDESVINTFEDMTLRDPTMAELLVADGRVMDFLVAKSNLYLTPSRIVQ